MQYNKTQNNTLVSIPHESIDRLVLEILNKCAKGPRQFNIAYYLKTSGHIYYKDMHHYDKTALDNYITRVQKEFTKYAKYNNSQHWHIYFGQLNDKKDFGYYLYRD